MKPRLHIDIETRSAADLKKVGPYVYAEHPTTEIIVVCWALDDGPVTTWRRFASDTAHSHARNLDLHALQHFCDDPDTVLVAHNAGFERTLLTGEPGRALGLIFPADLARWDCTMARATAFGLPHALDGAANALDMGVTKDREGHALMLRMCKPRKPRKDEPKDGLLWWELPEQIDRLAAYCAQDVVVERAIDHKIPDLEPAEREAWHATMEMNDHGIPVDTVMLPKLMRFIDFALEGLDRDIAAATGGAVPRVSDHGALTRWLTAQGIKDHIDDDDKASVAKGVLEGVIANPGLDPLIRSVLALRLDGGGAAIKKFDAMDRRLLPDGRVRGELVYCGAAATRRWSSRGVQFQNLIRGGELGKNLLHAVRDLLDDAPGDWMAEAYGLPPLLLASEMLRPAVQAPDGQWIVRGDLSQIEARVIAWLAGAHGRLATFRAADAGTGPDQYRVTAAGLLRKPIEEVTKKDRQDMGKVPELALGFQGGANALQTGAAKAHPPVIIPGATRPKDAGYDWQAPEGTDLWVVQQWRAANPEIVQLWRDCEAAAVECLQRPVGETVPVGEQGRLRFRRSSAVMVMVLPSGRPVPYWTPRLKHQMTPWGKRKLTFTYRGQDTKTGRWEEFTAYGGLLAQNATQAAARDVMRDIVLELRGRRDFTPFLLVHDEAINLALKSLYPTADAAAAALLAVMTREPAWAPGLPVNAEASAADRYVKV